MEAAAKAAQEEAKRKAEGNREVGYSCCGGLCINAIHRNPSSW